MPKLENTSNSHFGAWKAKALLYFEQHGLKEIVTHPCRRSLQRAIKKAGKTRDFQFVLQKWLTQHEKAFALIRAATQNAIGMKYYRDLENEAINEENEASDVFDKATTTDPDADLPINDPDSWVWIDNFRYSNAHFLWTHLLTEYQQYSGFDQMRLLTQWYNIPKYKEGEDPIRLLHLFQNRIHEMELADIIMPDNVHWAIWLLAIPDSMKSLQNQLGMQKKGSYMEVYEALKAHYSRTSCTQTNNDTNKKNKKRDNDESDEQLKTVQEKPNPKDKRYKPYSKHRRYPKNQDNKVPNRKCDYCDRTNHETKNCWELQKHKKEAAEAATKPGMTVFSFIEIENNEEQSQELACSASDSHTNAVFLFDSGATTHLTGSKNLLVDIKTVPEVSISTAVRGAHAVVRERGKVILNENYALGDVAYMSNASNNLISEGRLCDADCSIIKTKEYLLVKDKNGNTILRGVRVNRLWVHYLGGQKSSPRSTSNIIANRRRQSNPPPGGKDPKVPRIDNLSFNSSSSSSSSSSLSSASETSPRNKSRKDSN
jgi:hypothetical protein